MANDELDLKRQIQNSNITPNEFLKTIIINLVSTTLLCIIFICANFIIQTNLLNTKLASLSNTNTESDYAADEEAEVVKHGVIVDLGDFVLNLADSNSRRYLKTNVALEISQSEQEAEPKPEAKKSGHGHGGGEEEAAPQQSDLEKRLTEYKPAIRDAIITTLSSKTVAELSTVAGKELAKEQIMSAVNGILAGQNEVLRVSFGQFIIQ